MADIHELRRLKELEMQMQIDALPEAERQRFLLAQKKPNAFGQFMLGIVIGLFVFFGIPILLGIALR